MVFEKSAVLVTTNFGHRERTTELYSVGHLNGLRKVLIKLMNTGYIIREAPRFRPTYNEEWTFFFNERTLHRSY